MKIFSRLDKELKQAIRLLSLGTFLEFFDFITGLEIVEFYIFPQKDFKFSLFYLVT